MNTFIVLLSLLYFQQGDPDMQKVRSLYERAPMDESACENLLNLLKEYDENDPLLHGYKGVATMIMAKHVFSPFKKLSRFKEGKNILEKAIEKDPANVELRFLRFTAQSQAPGFLGYKDHLEEDTSFLIKSLPTMENTVLKKQIRDFLLESDSTTDMEKEKINNQS